MAGGTFTGQNKVLPGAYTNVVTAGQTAATSEDNTGVVFTAVAGLDWGASGVVEVTAATNFLATFGRTLDDAKLTALKYILLNAKSVLVYNLNAGTKASAEPVVLPWSFEATNAGAAGNKITVAVTPDPAIVGKYQVKTLYGAKVVDQQNVKAASDLVANDYIVPTVLADVSDNGAALLGALNSPVSVSLTGGITNDPSDNLDDLTQALETYEFNIMTAAGFGAASTLHTYFAQTAMQLRDDKGIKVQAVIPEIEGFDPDNEGVIVVSQSFVLADGTELAPTHVAGWVAGAEANAAANQSLTYSEVAGVVDAKPRLNEDQQIEAIENGKFVFITSRGTVKVLQDINSLHSYTAEKNASLSKNRVLRVVDTIANNTRETWEDSFIGQITNDAAGLTLWRANRVAYLQTLQAEGALTGFTADDVVVQAGDAKDAVVTILGVQPTDAMEKLYTTINSN